MPQHRTSKRSRKGPVITATAPDDDPSSKAPSRADESSKAASYGTLASSSDQSRTVYSEGKGIYKATGSENDKQESPGRNDRTRRRNRQRSGAAAFLLHDGGGDSVTGRRPRAVSHSKRKETPLSPDQQQSRSSRDSASQAGSLGISRQGDYPPSPANSGTRSTPSRTGSTQGEPGDGGSPSNARTSLDADATQIVHMALNLSESRRMASRRSAPPANPPRLTPIPDSTSRSNLRQHLQQQRRASRTGSPKPRQVSSPRVPSGFRANSPLQPGVDGQNVPGYHYQFSESTLGRAQKAKDHLELMALYRELLEYLPPLKATPGAASYHPSIPDSPISKTRTIIHNTAQGTSQRIGRPYDPLQYIRNRKVRARERKIIDGEQLGFADTDLVREWVNQLADQNSNLSDQSNGQTFAIPSFAKADETEEQISSDAKAAVRGRRPKVDWVFDPCDMIADAYWLEQDHHKHLIEDRFLRRIFPSTIDSSRPSSRQANDLHLGGLGGQAKLVERPATGEHTGAYMDASELVANQGGSRERAKQKLQARGFHHRHNSSHSYHDFLHGRDSISDTSGSDSDGLRDKLRKKRPVRRDTITSDASDLLQKQMLNMVAQEEARETLGDLIEHPDEHRQSIEPATPENKEPPKVWSRSHSREASVAGSSDAESRVGTVRSRLGSSRPYYRARQSLEVPDDTRYGVHHDTDVSAPTSPLLSAGGDNMPPPLLGLDYSAPPSRAGSPSRNPLSKVRRKLRERGRDNGGESPSEAEEDGGQQMSWTETPQPDGQKVRRESANARNKDESVGIRGIFKGPRIDTVIRGGVSKIGDIIWKKDASSDSDSDSSSDSEIDATKARTRPILSRAGSKMSVTPPNAKHFYDVMPQIHSISETASRSNGLGQAQTLALPELSRPQSRQSARWEQLKPPRLDVNNSTLTPSPVVSPLKGIGGSEMSESESNQQSTSDERQVPSHESDKSAATPSGLGSRAVSASRHWSIADRNPGPDPERTRLSKREVARLRALILSSGVKAMEINRRANEIRKPLGEPANSKTDSRYAVCKLDWDEMIKLNPECGGLREEAVPTCGVYPLASRALDMAIQASGQRWKTSADRFANKTAPALRDRVWQLRSRLGDDLSGLTRKAADEADETNKGLALDQPMKVKHVLDALDTLLRQRRRRFRWVRRGMWLAVEWVLIGFMWYVWFVVMIFRLFMGVGRVTRNSVKWLLWL